MLLLYLNRVGQVDDSRFRWISMAGAPIVPLRVGVFNVVGGRCILPCQVTLVKWYSIVMPCHASVLRIGARDLFGTE